MMRLAISIEALNDYREMKQGNTKGEIFKKIAEEIKLAAEAARKLSKKS